jgi:hypothetical protein
VESAATHTGGQTTWKVSNDGTPIAHVASYRDGAGVVVTAQICGGAGEAERIRPYRFERRDEAEAFVSDLVASFSYLGCHVARP